MTLLMYGLQENLPEESQVRDFLDQVLTFLYTLAHWSGQLVARLVEVILGDKLPANFFDGLIDPIGFLILLTLFLAVAEIAKRIAWLVVIIGWALILIRIVMELLGS